MQTLSEFLYVLSARLSGLCFELRHLRSDPRGHIGDHIYNEMTGVVGAAIAVRDNVETRMRVVQYKSSLKKLDALVSDVDRLVDHLNLLRRAMEDFSKIPDDQLVGRTLLELASDNFADAEVNFEKLGKYYSRQDVTFKDARGKSRSDISFEEPSEIFMPPSNAHGWLAFETTLGRTSSGTIQSSYQQVPLDTLVPVFFATDRGIVDGSEPPKICFKNGRGAGALSYGVAEVSIPPGHKMGRLERPAIWKFQFTEDIKKHVVVTSCEVKDIASWKSTATDRINKSSSSAALVYIHGYNTSFDEAIRHAAQIGFDLQFDGLITAYSWSSEARLDGYFADEENIKLTVPLLMHFLQMLRVELGVDTIHVIAHSMGNRALVEVLSTTPGPLLKEVVMAAPDIDADVFKAAVSGLGGKALRYTLYGSKNDTALAASKKLHKGYPRAGDGGDSILVVNGVETVDASAVGDDLLGLGHAYFASKRTLLSDLSYIIRKSSPPGDRHGLDPAMKEMIKYWLFRA